MCRTPLAAVFVSMFALFLQASCSGQIPMQDQPESLTIGAALASIDALQAPPGSDSRKFDSLRSEARQQLLATGRERWLARAPQGQQNLVTDLQLVKIDDFSATASWSYRNVGDYDQNSEANIADLTPLGARLGRSSSDPDWNMAQLADGDGNGEVNIADITPLGANLLSRVDGYFLQSTSTPLVESSWATAGIMPFQESTLPGGGGRRRFSLEVAAQAGQSFRVLPFAGTDNGVAGLPFAYTGQDGGPELSFEERSAVLEMISVKFDNLIATTSEGQDQELADFIATLPHIEAAGQFQGNAWGRFTDGRLAIVCKNREPFQAEAQVSSHGQRGISTVGLPSSEITDLFNSFGPGVVYRSPVNELDGILEGNGYTSFADPTKVSLLKVVKDSGLFYIDAHGGTGVQRDNSQQYSIWTDEPYTAENEEAFKEDLGAGRLLYMFAMDAAGANVWKYAFSDDFVSTYMTFSDNSLVFINACNSGNAADMVSAFHNAGASVYLGWSVSVDDNVAYNAATHLIDRVLGANVLSRDEDPPIRPFSYLDTLYDMYDRGTSTGSPLKYPPGPVVGKEYLDLVISTDDGDETTGFWLLAPTISYLAMGDQTGELYINGEFGDQEGTVTVGGTPVEVTQWQHYGLVCNIPDSGPGSYGDVVVTVRGHNSNVRQLTEWRGTMDFRASGQGTLRRDITFSLHLRADVGDWRVLPGTDPLLLGPFGTGQVPVFGAGDSKASVHSQGSYTDLANYTTTWRDGPQTELPINDLMLPLTEFIMLSGQFSLAENQLKLSISASGQYGEKQVDDMGETVHDDYYSFYDDMDNYFGTGEGIVLNLDDSYNLEAGDLQFSEGDFSYSLSWGPIQAQVPPNGDAAR